MIQAIILAGGKGERLGKLTENIPKPMVKIGKISILEHQINLLKRYGIKEILVLTGHLSEIIENFLAEKDFGIKIRCLKSDPEIGNADRLKLAEKHLLEDFLVLYGDIMLDMDLERLINFHREKKSFCTLTLHPNDYPHDSDLVEIDENKKIICFHTKPHPPEKYLKNLDNTCVYVISPKIFKYIKSKKGQLLDFGKHIFPKLIKREKFFGYNTPEYIKDMGTPERLKQINKDYLNGKIKRLNIKNKRKAIFLDRDGVISFDPGHLRNINKFQLLPNSAKAIKLINSSEYLVIVITNQAAIARKLLNKKNLEEIHKKMETLLGRVGAKLDQTYYCPHHPEDNCQCRKPKIGMLKKAEKEFNIDLSKSWIIGDAETDIVTGKNAGLKTILVKKNQEKFRECRLKTKKAKDLYSAVKLILK